MTRGVILMDNTLATILGDTLPAEMLATLQEAFEKKVAEAKSEAEVAIREEFAVRYEHDKANLVEAIDRMLTDTVTKLEEEKAAEITQLKEARANLDAKVNEHRDHYKTKIAEHIALIKTFVSEQLTKHITSLVEEKQSLVATQRNIAESFNQAKADMLSEHKSHLKKIDEFVVKQLTRELTEFNEDHRALVETRVKLISESKSKLKETQARFVKEAAAKADAFITSNLKSEMAQLHEDLEAHRQNMFGRRIFEAVAAEFMTSYLNEGSEVSKLKTVLETKEEELASVNGKLAEAAKAIEAVGRKVKLAEDRASRAKIMSELLSNLRGDKRSVMESMLETTKTENLRETFNKLLPVVIESASKPQNEKKVLSETKLPTIRRMTEITGDKTTNNRLFESASVDAESGNDAEIGAIIRLAGIQK
jgi:hypothetical protein